MAWVATDDFESYADSTSISGLNGGSGWSAAWSLSGGTLSTTSAVTYNGVRAVTATSAGLGGNNASRQFTSGVTGKGRFYVAMRRSSNSSGELRFNVRNQADSDSISIILNASGNIVLGSSSPTTVTSYSANTWYLIRVTFDVDAGTYTAAVSTSAYGASNPTWTAESASKSFQNSATSLNYVLLDFGASTGTGVTNYWDLITPTNPFTGIQISTTANAQASGTTTVTASAFPIFGSDNVLVCSVCDQSSGAGSVTGVTANGVSMTEIDTQSANGAGNLRLFGLINPTSGDIVATRSATGDRITICAVSYTGVSQSTAVSSWVKTKGSGSATTLTGTLTTPVDNCWTTMGTYVSSGGDTTSAGSGTTKRVTGPEIEDHWDSNGAIASAGSTTLNVNNGSTYSYGYIMVALQPSVPSTGVTGRLMMMGMGR